MIRDVKVNLPINSPDGTLKLCKKISDKHTALGAASPLTGFLDMAAFETKRADTAQKQLDGNTRMNDSQALHGQATKLCGISQGQNKQTVGTLYWYLLQIRDVLLIKNRTEEENLSPWGYNVVISQTGARRNVRVDIPNDNAENLSSLAATIKAKHIDLGAGSPLTGTGIDMTDFGTKTDTAVGLVQAAETARADAQAFHGQALTALGYSEGQTSETEGTLYFSLITIRNRLLQANPDEEENLTQWGFDVVITGHSTGKKAGSGGGGGNTPPPPIVIAGSLNALIATTLDTSGVDERYTMAVLAAITSTMRYYLTATSGGLPNPGAPFLDVLPGQTITKTLAELQALLGGTDLIKYLNVQNVGITTGEYQVTFS